MAGTSRIPLQVVVSYYSARPLQPLEALLRQLQEIEAGSAFRTQVVVNRAYGTDVLPVLPGDPEVLYRPNTAYNIGAWDHGWRMSAPADAYLFLQDDCRLLRSGWAAAFATRAADPAVGLVGERFNEKWAATWTEVAEKFRGHRMPGHEIDGRPADRVDCYLHFLRSRSIPTGERADHLQTLVLAARREVLEEVNGFPRGSTYGEAIASEIAASKRIEGRGWRLTLVGKAPFTYFDHPQWTGRPGQAAAPED